MTASANTETTEPANPRQRDIRTTQLHLYNLPDLADWPESERRRLVSIAMVLVMLASIAGNFAPA